MLDIFFCGNQFEPKLLLRIGRNLVFGDIGSGCGRLVLAQALTWPWRSCRGVEKVLSLHDMGEEALLAARRMGQDGTVSSEALRNLKTMAPCALSLGDVNDEVQSANATPTNNPKCFSKQNEGRMKIILVVAEGRLQISVNRLGFGLCVRVPFDLLSPCCITYRRPCLCGTTTGSFYICHYEEESI